jgi:DNA-binding transcriptional MerR regulator
LRKRFLSTKKVAEAAGVHPNTVRKYEEWGFLPPVQRTASGYRLFTEEHVEQLRLARLTLHGQWPGATIRHVALELVQISASGDLPAALKKAQSHLLLVQAERARADIAAEILQKWADSNALATDGASFSTSEVAKHLDITIDALRTWERNGLLQVPRNPANGYRRYGSSEIARLQIIRLLVLAGYSHSAILRMLLHLGKGRRENLKQVLDTPDPEEDIYTAADRWLTALAEHEQRALAIVQQVEYMLTRFQH